MKRIGCWLALGMAVAAAPAAAQGTFEGVVTYQATGAGGQSGEIKLYQKGDKMRQEMTLGTMQAASIYDGSSGKSIMLIPQQKKYMVLDYGKMSEQMKSMAKGMPGGQGDVGDLSTMKVTATGQKETIAGVECEHYLFRRKDDDQSAVDICGATGMGFTGFGSGAGGGMVPSTKKLLGSGNPELEKLAEKGFFTLSLKTSDGDDRVAMRATQVDRRKLGDDLFGPPSDYTEIKLPGGGGR